MEAFRPTSLSFIGQMVLVSGSILFFGFFLSRIKKQFLARGSAWALVLLSFLGSLFLSWDQPPGLRMLAICASLLYSMKIVVLVEFFLISGKQLRLLAWLCFCVFWFGMEPEIFQSLGRSKLPGAFLLVRKGLLRLGLGLLWVGVAWWLGSHKDFVILATIFVLPGLSLILHFGIFNILSGFWRYFGVPSDSLFKAPLVSKSLTEFWGRRWNLPFSEMTRITVYKPLLPKLGRNFAAFAAFLFSGLLHELAISVPVRAGYGLPLSYFFIHGMLLQIERYLRKKQHPIDQYALLANVWTLFWLILPLPLLFQVYFLRGIIWPIIGIH